MALELNLLKETNAFYCLECGKCTGVCPVARYSGSFSPRRVLARSLFDSHPGENESGGLWSCLTCGQCEEVCPSNIDYDRFIQLQRKALGIEKREGACSHGGIIESISRLMSMEKINQNRLDWLDRSMVSDKSDVLFFTGCLPYFEVLFEEIEADPLNIARSTLKILNHMGVKPQVLANERCCGHDFFWNGDYAMFEKLAQTNLALIEKSGVKTVITACPECYRTIKKDYPSLNGKQSFAVLHISEFIAKNSDKLKFHKEGIEQIITFQDPCRLGRHMSVYDAPREVLSGLPGMSLTEMAHHHRRAICCGVSGWMNCSQISKNIQANRLREAHRTGAEILVTACIKCKIHLMCAMRDQTLHDEVGLTIRDMTEVVAEHLEA